MSGLYLPGITKESLFKILSRYFSIGDSYTYELTRVKEAFELRTMDVDDFLEWGEDEVDGLIAYLLKETGATTVPDHGRLIEASYFDFLTEDPDNDPEWDDMRISMRMLREYVKDTPTIIPADE